MKSIKIIRDQSMRRIDSWNQRYVKKILVVVFLFSYQVATKMSLGLTTRQLNWRQCTAESHWPRSTLRVCSRVFTTIPGFTESFASDRVLGAWSRSACADSRTISRHWRTPFLHLQVEPSENWPSGSIWYTFWFVARDGFLRLRVCHDHVLLDRYHVFWRARMTQHDIEHSLIYSEWTKSHRKSTDCKTN